MKAHNGSHKLPMKTFPEFKWEKNNWKSHGKIRGQKSPLSQYFKGFSGPVQARYYKLYFIRKPQTSSIVLFLVVFQNSMILGSYLRFTRIQGSQSLFTRKLLRHSSYGPPILCFRISDLKLGGLRSIWGEKILGTPPLKKKEFLSIFHQLFIKVFSPRNFRNFLFERQTDRIIIFLRSELNRNNY